MTTLSSPVTSMTASPASSVTNAMNNTEIASDFTTFLRLLTTQLQNQDPLSPMDTNQFTQQLVEFASVEQQMKSNDALTALVALQQASLSTAALSLVGATVVVDGSTTQLASGQATWLLDVSKPATAAITIKDSTGQTVYSGTVSVNPGGQNFVWDGTGTDGTVCPDGAYTMTATATDASGQTTAVTTEIQARVDSVDLTQNPPLLSINGQNYTLNQILKIVAPAAVQNSTLNVAAPAAIKNSPLNQILKFIAS
jgi:flagellar basal-body rod modification protein FlgD